MIGRRLFLSLFPATAAAFFVRPRAEQAPGKPQAIGPPSDCFRFMEAAERKAGRTPVKYEVSEKLWNDLRAEMSPNAGPVAYWEDIGVAGFTPRLAWLNVPILVFDATAEVPEDATYALVTSVHRVLPPCGPLPKSPRVQMPYDLRWKWPQDAKK